MEKEKVCADCLHCKVSAKSTDNCKSCFCSQIGKKAIISEIYWFNKSICNKFEDMHEQI